MAGAASFEVPPAFAEILVDAVEDFRGPVNETESRFFLVRMLDVDDALPDTCRGTRDDTEFVTIEGEDRMRLEPVTVFVADVSTADSIIPNSFNVGDGFVDVDEVCAVLLCRLLANVEVFRLGEPVADVRLEIRGIFVGVSFGKEDELLLRRVMGGPSFETDVLAVPTDGEPAMVGSWCLLRSDVSDCFCMELMV